MTLDLKDTFTVGEEVFFDTVPADEEVLFHARGVLDDEGGLAGGNLLLPHHGQHPRNIFLQLADLLQALGLPHLELELHLEELVRELALLVAQLDIGQVAYFVYIHR